MKIGNTQGTHNVPRVFAEAFDAKTMRLFRRQMRKSWKKYQTQGNAGVCFQQHWFHILKQIYRNRDIPTKKDLDWNIFWKKHFSNPCVVIYEDDHD